MIQNVLSNIGGVGIYGIISIGIFFTVFLGAVIWVLGLKKSYRDAMRELPLEDESAPTTRLEMTPDPDCRHE